MPDTRRLQRTEAALRRALVVASNHAAMEAEELVRWFLGEVERTVARGRGRAAFDRKLDELVLLLERQFGRLYDRTRMAAIMETWREWGDALDIERQPPLAPFLVTGATAALIWGQTAKEASSDLIAAAVAAIRSLAATPVERTTLARGIRRAIEGDTFPAAFAALNLADRETIRAAFLTLDPEQRNALRRLISGLEQAAAQESIFARLEAETVLFKREPSVYAVLWRVASERGMTRVPDICDVLASVDHYGLGPGVYPVDRVPPVPHPWCRCSRRPIFGEGPRPLGMAELPVDLARSVPGFGRHTEPYQRRVLHQLALSVLGRRLLDEGTGPSTP